MAINAADTVWVLISSALVLLMLPGLALFYGGLVQRKNVLSSMMHSFVAMGVMALEWVIIGYSLAFSEGNWFVGGLGNVFLRGIDAYFRNRYNPHLCIYCISGNVCNNYACPDLRGYSRTCQV